MTIETLDHIWIALVMTLCTLSVYNLTREGQLFYPLRQAFDFLLNKIAMSIYGDCNQVKRIRFSLYISKPLFNCPPCMASVWGSIFYWSIFGQDVKTWIVCVLISSILNKIIYGYVE